MKYKKKLIVLAISSILSAGAVAQNLGFEDGNTTGWTSSTLTAVGSTTTQAGPNTWVINPYGSYMGQLQIQSGSYSSMATALGLTSSSTTAIQTMLNTQAQTSGGNPNPTTAGWVTKQVTLTAGTTFTLAWQYVSVDYVPYNDGSIATLTQNGTDVATVNNYQQQYALLGFTNPGTGDYSTGSYGATGWQVATFQVSVDGTYTLGFGVFNMGDTALSPVLYLDEVQGTTTLNGQAFGAVAPNNATAPSAPSSSGGSSSGGGSSAPQPVATVASGTTVDTSNLASSVAVNGGTIQIATTGITLTNTFTVDNNGMTIDQNGNSANFSGVISGSGGVTIANTGSGGGITFSAVNTYTGTTTINSNAGLENTGTIVGPIVNNGTLLNSGTAGQLTNNEGAVAVNSGTTGNVINSGSFANSGTTGNVNNSGTFNNTGNVATANNSGVFNNQAGGTINELGYNNFLVNNSGTINSITYNGGNVANNVGATIGTINNTEAHGTFNNWGTVTGDVTTNSSFNNFESGVVQGNYTNNGTLHNAGSLNTVINNSNINNHAGATIASVTNNSWLDNFGTVGNWINNDSVSNNGTMGNGTNNSNATFGNRGTVGSVNNFGTFNNYYDGTVGAITLNTGSTFINDGTAASVDNTAGVAFTNNGNITGLLANAGNVTNAGTVGSLNNTGTFTNTGSIGNITNSGTLIVNGGSIGGVSNTGSLNLTGAGSTINLGNYTQSAPGSTVINGNQQVVVSGTANLGGDLQIVNAPVGYGYHSYLTAGTLTGQYDTLTLNPDLAPLGYGLVYTGTGVQLKVTPSSTYTMNSVNNNVSGVASANNALMGLLNGALGYDCAVFGENNTCLSTGVYGLGGDGTKVGGVYAVVGRQISARWRAGLSVDQGLNKISVGNVSATTNSPSFGGFVNWNMNPDGQGLALRASGSITSSNMTINRDSSQYSESAKGSTSADGYAYQLKASYTMLPTTQRFNITPYIGVRRTSLAINGYTEKGAVFPLTYNSINQSTTDALAGTSVSYDFTDKLSGFVSAGVIKNLSYSAGAISGTSGIYGLQTFNAPLPGSNYTSTTLGAGLTYDTFKNQFVSVSAGWQQKTLTNTSQVSGAVSYTIGF